MMELEIDLEVVLEGDWFSYQNSHLNQETGKIVFDELPPDFNPDFNPKVRVRSMKPFLQERLSNRKKVAEFVLNHKTNSMERISYFKELSPDEERKQRDDLYDYIITGLIGFKNKRTGEVIECTRKNKLELMLIPAFDRFIDQCLKTIEETEIKRSAAIEKNL